MALITGPFHKVYAQEQHHVAMMDAAEKFKCTYVGAKNALFHGSQFAMTECISDRQGGRLHLSAWDVSTGKVNYEKWMDPPIADGEEYALEHIIGLGDDLWVFFIMMDRAKGEGVYSIQAWPLDPVTGASAGEVVRVGEVSFRAAGSRVSSPTEIGLTFTLSPDHSHIMVNFDRLQDKDKNTLLCTWYLGAGLAQTWSAIFQLPSHARVTQGLMDNEGTLYAVFGAGVEFPVEGSKEKKTHHVLRLTEKGYGVVPSPQPKEGNQEIRATAALMPDGSIMLGGILLQGVGRVNPDPLQGTFFQKIGADLAPIGQPSWKDLPGSLKGAKLTVLSMHPRPDGGAYMVAETVNPNLVHIELLVASSDPQGSMEWVWTTPRYNRILSFTEGQGLVLKKLIGNDLYVIAGNTPRNIEATKNGDMPKVSEFNWKEKMEVLRFSGSGTPERTMLAQDIYLHSLGRSFEDRELIMCGCLSEQTYRGKKRLCRLDFQ